MEVDLTTVGATVREARERAGLSQRALEAATGISQSTLHRVEIGKHTTASLADFDRIAQALDVRLDELLYGSPVRERARVAARTASGCDVRESLQDAMDHGIELLKLDDRLDAVVPYLRQATAGLELDLPASGSPGERGEAAAKWVRDALCLGIAPIADLVEIVERLAGVDVGTAPLPQGVSGICATDPQRETTIVLINSDDVAERQRFTLAHELGHLVFGDGTHVDEADGQRTPREITCDEFARHLLIPQDGIRTWLSPPGGSRESQADERTMALLSRHFGTSPEVTRIQLRLMDLLPTSLAEGPVPSGRQWAYEFGWGPQFDSTQEASAWPRVPRRILDRATEAYRDGKLGVRALARLQNRPVEEVEQALAEAGVRVAPVVRRADISALTARARARSTLGNRPGT
jgi:Zn-dependent peptidase ImmA (M78 family)/transcriptional regulator with XRE-family HTH domain